MLIRLADRLTARSRRLMPINTRAAIRALKAAWLLRALASWLRGGEWRSLSSFDAAADRVARRSQPPSSVALSMEGWN